MRNGRIRLDGQRVDENLLRRKGTQRATEPNARKQASGSSVASRWAGNHEEGWSCCLEPKVRNSRLRVDKRDP